MPESEALKPLEVDNGWHSRGYLPHFDRPGLVQSITFRLADSLPATVLDEVGRTTQGQPAVERRRRIDAYLDAGHGSSSLRQPQIGQLVEEALWHFDGTRYRLLAWVIMPNHVHTVIAVPGNTPVRRIVQSWKSFTALEANRRRGGAGRFWQPDYFDRTIRDERHLKAVIQYIENNPVQAGLATQPEDWPFSSARLRLDR